MKALLLLLALSLPIVAQKPLTIKYDKFKDTTTASVGLLPLPNLMVNSFVNYPGRIKPEIDSIRVLFIGQPSFWPSAASSWSVDVITDTGQRASYTANYISTFQVSGIVSTLYGATLTMGEFGRIACARSVEMRVAFQDVPLKKSEVKRLRALLEFAGGSCGLEAVKRKRNA